MKKGIWALSLIFIFSLFICPALGAEGGREGFRPDRAEWLSFGGEIRLDLIVPEEAESYVYLDRVEIEIKAIIAEGVYSKGTIRFTHDPGEKVAEVDIPEWYTRFTLGDHWLRVGLTDRFIVPGDLDRGSRRTAGYPLAGIAFWRDEQYNLTLGGMFPLGMGDFRYRLSFGSGLRLSDRRPGDHRFTDPDVGKRDELFHDDDHGMDGDEFGVGLGFRYHFGDRDTLDVIGFGIWSRIPGDSRPKGSGLTGFPQKNDQHRIGGRIVYRLRRRLRFMAEYIDARDGNLRRNAWYLQASRKFEFANPLIGGRFLTAVEPLIRYGHHNVDTANVFTDPLTWDRQQLTLALLTDIARNVSLRIEYDINDEDTGGREIANNEFRVQLRTRW